MSVTYATTRIGETTQVTVASDLVPPVYLRWYLDGQYLGMTTATARSFAIPHGEQVRIEVIDTDDPDFVPPLSNPYGPKRLLFWLRSLAAEAALSSYRIEQKIGSGAWVELVTMPAVAGRWSYEYTTARLADNETYTWRITPIDATGLDGTPLVLGPELLVRVPDSPEWDLEYDPETGKVELTIEN